MVRAGRHLFPRERSFQWKFTLTGGAAGGGDWWTWVIVADGRWLAVATSSKAVVRLLAYRIRGYQEPRL